MSSWSPRCRQCTPGLFGLRSLTPTIPIRSILFAAMDTTSNTIARLLHLLALHADVQQKLRDEIIEAQAGDEIPYDQLDNLPFLESVCRETLRLCVFVPRCALSSVVADTTSVLQIWPCEIFDSFVSNRDVFTSTTTLTHKSQCRTRHCPASIQPYSRDRWVPHV